MEVECLSLSPCVIWFDLVLGREACSVVLFTPSKVDRSEP